LYNCYVCYVVAGLILALTFLLQLLLIVDE
jgi:hypothetical protein